MSLLELCNTRLYSESRGVQRKVASKYISGKLGYPDPGSEFGDKIGNLRYLFRIPGVNGLLNLGIRLLQRRGYDVLLLDRGGQILGHTAFQIHPDNSLHVFSIEVDPNYRFRGLARHMQEGILMEARKKELGGVRLGAGSEESPTRICQNFASREEELGIEVREGNWIRLLY